MTDQALVTAVYDDYDILRPLPAGLEDVDCICLTDNPELTAAGWRMVYEPFPQVHHKFGFRLAKTQPWIFTDAEASVWMDASFVVKAPAFVAEAVAFAGDGIALFKHPARDCLYEEASYCIPMEKYEREHLPEQVGAYRAAGHPEHWGLFNTGVIARSHTEQQKRMGANWFLELLRFGIMDQVSMPYVLRSSGVEPALIQHQTVYDNPWVKFECSDRHYSGPWT